MREIQSLLLCSFHQEKGRKKMNILVLTNYMSDIYVLYTMESSQIFDVAIIISKTQMVA